MRACTDLCLGLKLGYPGHKLRYPGLLSPPVFDLLPMGRSHVNRYQSVTLRLSNQNQALPEFC